MSEECGDCKKKFGRKENAITCSSFCRKMFCKKCVDVGEYECNVLKHKNIMFVCDECKININDIMEKMDNVLKVVNENRVALNKQEKEIRSILDCVKIISGKGTNNEVKNVNKKSYAEIAVNNIPPIIIKPNSKQKSEETKAEIKETINPAELSLQISKVSKK